MKNIILILISVIIIFSGCGSFQTTKNDPIECKDRIDMLNIIAKSKGMFSKGGGVEFISLLTLAYSDCKLARAALKENKIQKLKDIINKLKLKNKELEIKIKFLQK